MLIVKVLKALNRGLLRTLYFAKVRLAPVALSSTDLATGLLSSQPSFVAAYQYVAAANSKYKCNVNI